MRATPLLALPLLACAAEDPLFSRVAPRAQEPPTATASLAWIGNSHGIVDERWFQSTVEGLAVASDGTVVVNSFDDPGGRLAGLYRDGEVLGRLGDVHAWGRYGGGAVAVDGRHVYQGMVQMAEGKPGEDYPPDGTTWYCVRRYTLDGRPSPFPTGRGWDGSLRIIGTRRPVRALAATARELYVSTGEGRVEVFDTATLAPLRGWALPGAGAIAVAPDGSPWIAIDDGAGARVQRHDPAGRPLEPSIAGVGSPVALAFDRAGRLLIADDGPRQQVLIFDELTVAPRRVGSLGIEGGVLGGAGVADPLRLMGLRGVAVDGAGRVYVGLAGPLPWGGASGVRAFGADGRALWSLSALHDGGGGDFDPASDGYDLYTKYQRFQVALAAGATATWRGWSVDPARFPDDVRAHVKNGAPMVRRVRGRPLLFHVTEDARALAVHRLDRYSELAIPVAAFGSGGADERSEATGGWPPARPAAPSWLWRDRNGNGAIDADEMEGLTQPASPGWWVDRRGDVWRAFETEGIARFALADLNASDLPHYPTAAVQRFPMPAPFVRLQRLQYDDEQDVMYLAGYTAERPGGDGSTRALGTELARYDGWSRQPTLRWRVQLPWGERLGPADAAVYPRAFSVAGDRLFITESRSSIAARVFDADTGRAVGALRIATGDRTRRNAVELAHGGVTAFRRRNGELLVLLQHDEHSQMLLFRLPPQWRE